ncbi:MAG: hypothetical protein ACJ72L_19000 [Marmoricola sp.]
MASRVMVTTMVAAMPPVSAMLVAGRVWRYSVNAAPRRHGFAGGSVGGSDGVLVLGRRDGFDVLLQDPPGEQRDLEGADHGAVPVGVDAEVGGRFGVGFLGFQDPGEGLVGDLGCFDLQDPASGDA